jgi:tripartite-type tricarboxylate transporter receptor subunit TctC
MSIHRVAIALSIVASFAGRAEAADFYQGKQLAFVVSADVGSSFDLFTRMIGRYLPKYIPGSPSIVPQNMPGAGGLTAANWLYNAAPRDGLTLAMINPIIPFDPIYGGKEAHFRSDQFNWLGSPSKETAALIVWHTVPVNSIEDARGRQLVLSATGTGSTPAFFARVLAYLFDLNIKIIPGYKSQPASFLAMERGENDGNASPFWSSLLAQKPEWIRDRKIKVLVYYGDVRNPDIPGPYVFDLIKDPEKRTIMEIAQAGLGLGHPIMVPPGVDPEKVATLRKALAGVFRDPAYLAECAKAKLDCTAPSSGDELLALVKRIEGSPKAAIDKIAAIYAQGRSP